jgi:predicted acylesterase/phospholipase RssA
MRASGTRVLALAGGGPVTGLHIGALKRLGNENRLSDFDVWSLSCIGAWVGIVYLQAERGREFEQTEAFFRDRVFRDDRSYARFPINTVFGPDVLSNTRALLQFLVDHESYRELWLPKDLAKATTGMFAFLANPANWYDLRGWTNGDFNQRMLESMSAHPWTRFLTSMMYLSRINGLSRIHYPGSPFLASLRFGELEKDGKPLVYHNAWNLDRQRLELFTNFDVEVEGKGPRRYPRITAESLCACSALPYIEATVNIQGDTYCEGALVDTVNFQHLRRDHPKLQEVWVSRLVDTSQIRAPRNLTEALGNLCMLFAAETGKNDIKLFKYHLDEERPDDEDEIRVVEIPVSARVSYDWSRSNLELGIEEGEAAVGETLRHLRRLDAIRAAAQEARVGIRDPEAELLLKLPGDEGHRIRTLLAIVASIRQRRKETSRQRIRAALLEAVGLTASRPDGPNRPVKRPRSPAPVPDPPTPRPSRTRPRAGGAAPRRSRDRPAPA